MQSQSSFPSIRRAVDRPGLNPIRLLTSHRIYLGVLLGLAVWVFHGLALGGIGGFSVAISVLLTMWVSGAYEPKRLIGLSVLVGFPAALFSAVQAALQETANSTGFLDTLLDWMVMAPLNFAVVMFYFVVAGLVYGTIARLYRERVIF